MPTERGIGYAYRAPQLSIGQTPNEFGANCAIAETTGFLDEEKWSGHNRI
jgi:hypothetical protein